MKSAAHESLFEIFSRSRVPLKRKTILDDPRWKYSVAMLDMSLVALSQNGGPLLRMTPSDGSPYEYQLRAGIQRAEFTPKAGSNSSATSAPSQSGKPQERSNEGSIPSGRAEYTRSGSTGTEGTQPATSWVAGKPSGLAVEVEAKGRQVTCRVKRTFTEPTEKAAPATTGDIHIPAFVVDARGAEKVGLDSIRGLVKQTTQQVAPSLESLIDEYVALQIEKLIAKARTSTDSQVAAHALAIEELRAIRNRVEQSPEEIKS